MTYKLIIRAEAETDLTDAAMWYESQRLGLGAEFLAELETAIVKMVDNPRQFRRLRRKPEVRRVLLERFPYRLFFVLHSDTVVVFCILHGARHDRAWKGKISEQ